MHLPVGYLIGLGSNIEPEKNIPLILKGLLALSSNLVISRIVRTKPKGIQSQNDFLNAVVFLPSNMAAEELKKQTNAIEARLGRDRTRPDKKWIDRTADIDLLIRINATRQDCAFETIESYLLPCAREVYKAMCGEIAQPPDAQQYQEVALDNVQLGKTPATIHRDDRTGLIGIVEHG